MEKRTSKEKENYSFSTFLLPACKCLQVPQKSKGLSIILGESWVLGMSSIHSLGWKTEPKVLSVKNTDLMR